MTEREQNEPEPKATDPVRPHDEDPVRAPQTERKPPSDGDVIAELGDELGGPA